MRTVSSKCNSPRRALVAVVGACTALTLALPAVADVPISAAVAGLYIGRDQVVEGKVEAAERNESTVRLHLGSTPQSLTVSLVIGLLSRFPAQPEQYYAGKKVRVTGTIESFRGAPEIIVHDPDHIQLIEPIGVAASAPHTGPKANAEEAAQLRQQVDVLRTQVRELESRLEELEHEAPKP